jgi:periplasmic protein TonB
MNKFLFLTACLACINVCYSQSVIKAKNEEVETKVFTKVDVAATFTGGDSAWLNFLKKNINASVAADNGAHTGSYKVTVRFIVSKDSSLSDVYCENDPGYGTCQEAIRLIKMTRKWIPASINGRNVNAYYQQPITFIVE